MKNEIALQISLVCAFTVWAFPLSAASVSIQRAEVERVEDGHPVLPPDDFIAGETVYFSFYTEGVTRKENDVKLSMEAQPEDPASVPLVPAVTSALSTVLREEDKQWQPKLRGSFQLPGVLGGGTYKILLRVKDELSGASASGELTFLVAGDKVESSDRFQIRDLDFYRTDEAEKPLANAAYLVSEEPHARFRVVGFQRDDHGVTDVAYGISVANTSGRALIAEPAASEDRSEDFYPKPFVPGIVSFTFKPGTPPGEYVLTVTAIDKIAGDQKAEARHTFRLE